MTITQKKRPPANRDESTPEAVDTAGEPIEQTTREAGVDDSNQEYEMVFRRITRNKPSVD